MPNTTEYDCTLKGTAQFALDHWTASKLRWPTNEDAENMILTGRCQAYSAILNQITGTRCVDQWQAMIDTMAS